MRVWEDWCPKSTSAFGGTADMAGLAAGLVANDPLRTLSSLTDIAACDILRAVEQACSMGKIFISYRREDDPGFALALSPSAPE